MSEWWNTLSVMHQIFYLIAIPATVILVLQTILLLFGLGGGHDIDHDVDHDFDHDLSHEPGHNGSPTENFAPEHEIHDQGPDHLGGIRLLTVRGFVAFFSVCGWVGVASLDLGANPWVSSLLAVLAGLGAMFLVALFLYGMTKLQQSGNIDMHNAVGLTGEVYVNIPRGGKGKVTLTLQEQFMEMDAVCTSRALKTGEPVKITGITDSNTLIVAPLH